MTRKDDLEHNLQFHLAQDIIMRLVTEKHFTYEQAMDKFYHSEFIDKLYLSPYGEQYRAVPTIIMDWADAEPQAFATA